jgi:hypothetical protein
MRNFWDSISGTLLMSSCVQPSRSWIIRGYIEKFPDWPLGARTENGTALYYYLQLYRYFVGQSSKFYRHNSLCYFSASVCCCCCCCCCCLIRYRLNLVYTLVYYGHWLFDFREIRHEYHATEFSTILILFNRLLWIVPTWPSFELARWQQHLCHWAQGLQFCVTVFEKNAVF